MPGVTGDGTTAGWLGNAREMGVLGFPDVAFAEFGLGVGGLFACADEAFLLGEEEAEVCRVVRDGGDFRRGDL